MGTDREKSFKISENIPPLSHAVSKFTMKLFEQMVEQILPLYIPMEKGPDFRVSHSSGENTLEMEYTGAWKVLQHRYLLT